MLGLSRYVNLKAVADSATYVRMWLQSSAEINMKIKCFQITLFIKIKWTTSIGKLKNER